MDNSTSPGSARAGQEVFARAVRSAEKGKDSMATMKAKAGSKVKKTAASAKKKPVAKKKAKKK